MIVHVPVCVHVCVSAHSHVCLSVFHVLACAHAHIWCSRSTRLMTHVFVHVKLLFADRVFSLLHMSRLPIIETKMASPMAAVMTRNAQSAVSAAMMGCKSPHGSLEQVSRSTATALPASLRLVEEITRPMTRVEAVM